MEDHADSLAPAHVFPFFVLEAKEHEELCKEETKAEVRVDLEPEILRGLSQIEEQDEGEHEASTRDD